MSKILVSYFSASGVTAKAADALAKAAGADIYEIKPETPYTAADLDWQNEQSRSTVEMRDKTSRPALADKNADISGHDVIFVGFPIWWHVAPTIINTFLESYDFSGKKIILFATSGGGGFGEAVKELKPSVSETASIQEGRLLKNTETAETLKAWLESLNL